jgi:oxygen-independent coproporphyrinogen-3 oxidase
MGNYLETAAGIYLHIPFCESICPYCDFYSVVADDLQVPSFVDALLAESNRAAEGAFGSFVYDTVYFGGGTPSILNAGSIAWIMERLRSRFEVKAGAEISAECNPSSLTGEKIRGYVSAGMNRISLGAQSLMEKNLRTLGRIHNRDDIFKAADNIRSNGISNFSLDLIYGMPGQSVEDWESDLEAAIDLGPEHISAYNLIIENGTLFGELFREGKLVLPDDDGQRQMYEILNSILEKAGYTRYEISNFAKPGFECRHNLKYWTGKPYLGLGPAAVSFDGKIRRKNKADLASYLEALKIGGEIPGNIETIDDDTALEEAIMGGLRLKRGLSLRFLSDRFGYDLLREKAAEIEALLREKMIEINNGFLSIADKALFISDSVMARLI